MALKMMEPVAMTLLTLQGEFLGFQLVRTGRGEAKVGAKPSGAQGGAQAALPWRSMGCGQCTDVVFSSLHACAVDSGVRYRMWHSGMGRYKHGWRTYSEW